MKQKHQAGKSRHRTAPLLKSQRKGEEEREMEKGGDRERERECIHMCIYTCPYVYSRIFASIYTYMCINKQVRRACSHKRMCLGAHVYARGF